MIFSDKMIPVWYESYHSILLFSQNVIRIRAELNLCFQHWKNVQIGFKSIKIGSFDQNWGFYPILKTEKSW